MQQPFGSKRLLTLGVFAVASSLCLAVPSAHAVGSGSPAPAIKVTQNSAETVVTNNSIACGSATDTAENHYYRRFDVSGSYAAAQGFKVSDVTFAVEATTGGTVPGTVTVSSIDHAAALTVANLTTVATTSVNLASVAAGGTITAPLSGTVPAGKDMVLEVSVAASTTGLKFYIGSNTAAESAPSYLRAPSCGAAEPVTMGSLGFAGDHIVLFGHGKAVDCINAETALDTANAAVTAATTKKAQATAAVTTATTADTAAKKALAKAKAKLKKAKKSGNAAKIKKAKKAVKKAKATAKSTAAALTAANTALSTATTALTAAQAAVTPATTTATTECAQPAIPAARPAPSAPAVGAHGFVTAGS